MGVDEGVPVWGCQMCHMYRKPCKTSVSPAAAKHKAHGNHPDCQKVRHETSAHMCRYQLQYRYRMLHRNQPYRVSQRAAGNLVWMPSSHSNFSINLIQICRGHSINQNWKGSLLIKHIFPLNVQPKVPLCQAFIWFWSSIASTTVWLRWPSVAAEKPSPSSSCLFLQTTNRPRHFFVIAVNFSEEHFVMS